MTRVAAILTMILGAVAVPVAQGTSYVVDSVEDVVQSDSKLTLREAIEAANTNTAVGDAPAGSAGEMDQISFDSSLTGGTILLDGTELSISDDLRIVGLGDDYLAIDANDRSRVFSIQGNETDAILEALTVTGGQTFSPYPDGGGLYVVDATVALVDCTVGGNSAPRWGAGLYASSSTVAVTSSTVQGNSTTGTGPNAGYGGGLCIRAGNLTVTDSVISGNSVRGEANYSGRGGGLHLVDSTATLENTTINDNSAWGGFYTPSGGGLYVERSSVVLERCDITENSATGTGFDIQGGGVWVGEKSSVELVDSVLSGNSAYGGGALCANPGQVAVTNSIVSGNSGHAGGGVLVWGGTVTCANSIISRNVAGYGGGFWMSDSATTTVTLSNSTVTANRAWSTDYYRNGGGFYMIGGSLTLNNSVLALNSAWPNNDIDGSYTGSANLVGVDPRFVRDPAPGPDGAWATVDDDPGDLHLRPDSPCIDAGLDALALDPDGQPLTADLDGNPRIIGGSVDIGAYEYAGSSQILTDADALTVPEGGSATFEVKLLAAPASDVTVNVSRLSGDADISVSSGSSLIFTPSNWDAYQTVTLSAAKDADVAHGVATIRCSAPSLANKDVLVTEQDNLLSAVYRFWSPVKKRHFYTIRDSERQKLIDSYSHVWTYEGIAYYALPDGSDPNSLPVYRFWSGALSAHFYTIDVAERDKLINLYSDVWTYEGPAFYAYPPGLQPSGTSPVYRFWSDTLSCHFYTMSESERDKLINTYSHVWTYEGVAWYAYE